MTSHNLSYQSSRSLLCTEYCVSTEIIAATCRPEGEGCGQGAEAIARGQRFNWRTGFPRTKRATRAPRETWQSR